MQIQRNLQTTPCAEMSIARRGFTLMEVLIALGVCGFAVAMLLGLFLRSVAGVREAAERERAMALAPAVRAALVEAGWSAETNQGPPGVVELTASGPFFLVANPDGSQVTRREGAQSLPAAEHYFLIEVTRHEAEGHRFGPDLRAALALQVLVTWPYRLPSSGGEPLEVALEQRSRHVFFTSIRL
jgi:prepilin-type N-terminal cleavage/methylation domain-containing protein